MMSVAAEGATLLYVPVLADLICQQADFSVQLLFTRFGYEMKSKNLCGIGPPGLQTFRQLF
jgi:hypothetical protein